MTVRGPPLLALIALLGACTNEIWLSDLDGRVDVDASHDAHVGAPRDAYAADTNTEVGVDAAILGERACERGLVTIAQVSETGPLEAPTLAMTGRLTTLRYGVLVPPAASLTATEDSRLVLLDREGAVLHERAMRLADAGGVATSGGTLHSFSSLATDEGFLLLTPSAIWLLDENGDGAAPAATLATPPSAAWQRAAGWIDADRFAFVSDTPDLRLAVFDRTTGDVTVTTISAAGAAVVHLESGGVTISSAGPASETVVYDRDLSGAEVLRTTWDDGTLLAARLLGVGFLAGERTWVVHDPSEFRTNVASYRISPIDPPVPGEGTALLGPLSATREGPFLAITSENPWVTLYAFETDGFRTVAMDFAGTPIVEEERDGANVSILFLEPAEAGTETLELACGRR